MVNQSGDFRNLNSLVQQFTTTVADVDPSDGKVHVRFALAPVLQNPNPRHIDRQQPYSWAQVTNVTKSTVLFQTFSFANQPGVPWKTSSSTVNGGGFLYTDWQSFDIAPGAVGLAPGDVVKLEVIAAGCSPGEHRGYVYVDGFGAFLPGLSVSAMAPQAANAGSDITYTFNYGNRGAGAAANTTVQFNLPTGVTYQSLSAPGASCTKPSVGGMGTVECNVGTVNPNATGSFTVTVNIDPGATGKISAGNYTIFADSVSALIGPLVETTITNGISYADLAATIQDNLAALGWGQTHTFSFVITNNGPTTATGATVAWTMPAQYASANWTCGATGAGSCGTASGSGSINATVTLAQGESATFSVTAVVISGSGTGALSNLVTVTAPAGVTDNNSSNSGAIHNAAIGTLRTLTFSKAGLGTGRVVSVPSAIDCGTGCTTQAVSFIDSMSVSLTATADTGSTFSSWSGACSGGSNPCNFTISGDAIVTATFDPPSYAITVSPTPTNGTVVCTTPVFQGLSSTCAITPAGGYALATLTDNDADVFAQVSAGQYVITNVTAAHTIAATFVYVPPVLTVTPGIAIYDALGSPVTLDPTLSLVGTGTITGTTVTIGVGFATGDVLGFVSQLGITGSYDPAKGILTLTGTAPVSDYLTALGSVTYSSTAGATPATALRTVTFAVGTAVSYQANSHFYEYISGGPWTWPQAEAAAAARTYYGLQGYLATIGDAAENAYVSAKLNGAGWMGASAPAGSTFPHLELGDGPRDRHQLLRQHRLGRVHGHQRRVLPLGHRRAQPCGRRIPGPVPGQRPLGRPVQHHRALRLPGGVWRLDERPRLEHHRLPQSPGARRHDAHRRLHPQPVPMGPERHLLGSPRASSSHRHRAVPVGRRRLRPTRLHRWGRCHQRSHLHPHHRHPRRHRQLPG